MADRRGGPYQGLRQIVGQRRTSINDLQTLLETARRLPASANVGRHSLRAANMYDFETIKETHRLPTTSGTEFELHIADVGHFIELSVGRSTALQELFETCLRQQPCTQVSRWKVTRLLLRLHVHL